MKTLNETCPMPVTHSADRPNTHQIEEIHEPLLLDAISGGASEVRSPDLAFGGSKLKDRM